MLRLLTAGESHASSLLMTLDGVPAGLPLTPDHFSHELYRRRQGYGRSGRQSYESDSVEILSGIRHGITTGGPIAVRIPNREWERNDAWKRIMDPAGRDDEQAGDVISIPRPGHADLVGAIKYGYSDLRDSIERASARETASRTAAAVVAKELLSACGVSIGSYVVSIGTAVPKTAAQKKNIQELIERLIRKPEGAAAISVAADRSEVRMLDPRIAKTAARAIHNAMKSGDTLGGIIEIIATGIPPGLGSYMQWDLRLDGRLAQAICSIPSVKGVEFGDAFENAGRYGSEVHDALYLKKDGSIVRKTNRAAGLEGGVTTGMPIVIRAALKPIPTLIRPLPSIDLASGKNVQARKERSDFCVAPAAGVVSEAMTALVLADAVLEKFGGDSMNELLSRLHHH